MHKNPLFVGKSARGRGRGFGRENEGPETARNPSNHEDEKHSDAERMELADFYNYSPAFEDSKHGEEEPPPSPHHPHNLHNLHNPPPSPPHEHHPTPLSLHRPDPDQMIVTKHPAERQGLGCFFFPFFAMCFTS